MLETREITYTWIPKGNFPTHLNRWGRGGSHSVQTKAQRNQIPYLVRELGMVCWVTHPNNSPGEYPLMYKLKSNPTTEFTTDADWLYVPTGADFGTGPQYVDHWDPNAAPPMADGTGTAGQYYIVENAPNGVAVNNATINDGVPFTAYNGDWMIYNAAGFWAYKAQATVLEWDAISGKPTTFPAEAHNHPISEISGLQAVLDAKVEISSVIEERDYTAQDSNSLITRLHHLKQHAYTKQEVDDLLAGLPGGGGSSTFLGLSDVVDQDYENKAGWIPMVRVPEDGIFLADPLTYFAPKQSSVEYWKTSGNTEIKPGTGQALVYLTTSDSQDIFLLRRTYQGVQSQLNMSGVDILLEQIKTGWYNYVQSQSGAFTAMGIHATTGTQRRSEVRTGSTSVALELYDNTLKRTGIQAGTTFGISLSDKFSSIGAHYVDDYHVNGIATYGDKWITDVGYVLGAKTYIGKQSISASGSGGAKFRIIPGSVLPNEVNLEDGDIFLDDTKIYARVGGATKELGAGTGGGSQPGGSEGNIQYYAPGGVLGGFGNYNGQTVAFDFEDSATNTIINILKLKRTTTADPVAGFGQAIVFEGTVQPSTVVTQGSIQLLWKNVNVGSESNSYNFRGYYNGALRDFIQVGRNDDGDSAISLEIGDSALGIPVQIEPRNSASIINLLGGKKGPVLSHKFSIDQSTGQSWAAYLPFDISGQSGDSTFEGLWLDFSETGRTSTGIANLLRLDVDSSNIFSLRNDGLITHKLATSPAGNPPSGYVYIYPDAADGKYKMKTSGGAVYDLTAGASGQAGGDENELQVKNDVGGFSAAGITAEISAQTRILTAYGTDPNLALWIKSKGTGVVKIKDLLEFYSQQISTVSGLALNGTSDQSLLYLSPEIDKTSGHYRIIDLDITETQAVESDDHLLRMRLNSDLKFSINPRGLITLKEQTNVGQPADTTGYFYPGIDGLLYWKNKLGATYDLTGQAGNAPLVVNLTDGPTIQADCQSKDFVYLNLTTTQSAISLELTNVKTGANINLAILKEISGNTNITLSGTGLKYKGYGSSPSVLLNSEGIANTFWNTNISVPGLMTGTTGGDPVLIDENSGTPTSSYGFGPTQYKGQTFLVGTGLGGTLDKCEWYVGGGLAAGTAYAAVYDIGSGTPGEDAVPGTLLATSDGFDCSTIDSPGFYTFNFSGAERITLSESTNYFLIVYNLTDGNNFLVYYTSALKSGSNRAYGSPGSWTTDVTTPLMFKVYKEGSGGGSEKICFVGGPLQATDL